MEVLASNLQNMPPQPSPSRTREWRTAPYAARAALVPNTVIDEDDLKGDLEDESEGDSEDKTRNYFENESEGDLEDEFDWVAAEDEREESPPCDCAIGLLFCLQHPGERSMNRPAYAAEETVDIRATREDEPYTLDFGKYKYRGMTLERLETEDPSYLEWITTPEFNPKRNLVDALARYRESLLNRRPQNDEVFTGPPFQLDTLQPNYQPPVLCYAPDKFRKNRNPNELLWISPCEAMKYFGLDDNYLACLSEIDYNEDDPLPSVLDRPPRFFAYDVWDMLKVHTSQAIADACFERWEWDILHFGLSLGYAGRVLHFTLLASGQIWVQSTGPTF